MKVVRAPLRVSLFGGGTDLDPFCSEHGSTIISFAIDRYIYLTWNERPTGGCHLGYSEVEELETLRDAKHTLVRETALRHGIEEPCTLTITSDLPKGTGLGSSSALAVCLAKLGNATPYEENLPGEAGKLEHDVSKAGWQDYLPAVYGGIHRYAILRRKSKEQDSPCMLPFTLSDHARGIVNIYGMLFYTGNSRPADSVLGSWQKSEEQLHAIKALADEVAERIDDIGSEELGKYLETTWELKRSISGVSDPLLNRQYALAMLNGALGGKLCGAGAGGCWFFLVPPSSVIRAKITNALGLREIPFKIAEKGVEAWEL